MGLHYNVFTSVLLEDNNSLFSEGKGAVQKASLQIDQAGTAAR